MRQFRESRYWIGEDGEVWRYFEPRKRITRYTWKEKQYQYEYDVPERWKTLKPQNIGKYKSVTLYFGDGKISNKQIDIHRLVAEVYNPGYFDGAHVDHIDNNPHNNHYTNLQWCTKEYNLEKRHKTTFPLYIEWNK